MTDIDTPNPPSNLLRSVSNILKGSSGPLVEWYDVYTLMPLQPMGGWISHRIGQRTLLVFYSAALHNNQVPLFIAYVTALIVGSLLVYWFLLSNRGPNWLDHPEEMRRRQESPSHRVFPMGA